MTNAEPPPPRYCRQCDWLVPSIAAICPMCHGEDFVSAPRVPQSQPQYSPKSGFSLSQLFLVVTIAACFMGFWRLDSNKWFDYFGLYLLIFLGLAIWGGIISARRQRRSRAIGCSGVLFVLLIGFCGFVLLFLKCALSFDL
jgi:hypothetical protein